MVKLYMQLAEQPLGERVEISGSINQTVIIPVHGPDDPLADEEPDGSDISE